MPFYRHAGGLQASKNRPSMAAGRYMSHHWCLSPWPWVMKKGGRSRPVLISSRRSPYSDGAGLASKKASISASLAPLSISAYNAFSTAIWLAIAAASCAATCAACCVASSRSSGLI